MEEKPPSPEISAELLQQHPALMIAVIIVMGLFMMYVVGGIGSWIFFGNRLNAGKPILAVEPWTPRAWGLADLLVIVLAIGAGQVIFASIGFQFFGVRAEEGKIPIALAMWAGFGNVAAMLVGVVWIIARFGVSPAHVGFNARSVSKQVGLGLLVGLGTLPMIYALMILVSLGFKTEYSHPLIDEMMLNGTLGVFIMGFITAAIIAPVTEEFLFRVIIQGWLQSIPFKSALTNVLGGRFEPRPTWQLAAVGESLEAVGNASFETTTPTGESSHENSDQGSTETQPENSLVPPIWPTIVTGVLFGLAHWGYGLSFVPLIALGIVLGFVYRATHSIWPCILIHCMLNGTSMALMGFGMLAQQVAK